MDGLEMPWPSPQGLLQKIICTTTIPLFMDTKLLSALRVP